MYWRCTCLSHFHCTVQLSRYAALLFFISIIGDVCLRVTCASVNGRRRRGRQGWQQTIQMNDKSEPSAVGRGVFSFCTSRGCATFIVHARTPYGASRWTVTGRSHMPMLWNVSTAFYCCYGIANRRTYVSSVKRLTMFVWNTHMVISLCSWWNKDTGAFQISVQCFGVRGKNFSGWRIHVLKYSVSSLDRARTFRGENWGVVTQQGDKTTRKSTERNGGELLCGFLLGKFRALPPTCRQGGFAA